MPGDDVQIRGYRPSDRERVLELHEVALRQAGGYVEGAPEPDLDDIQAGYFDKGGDFVVGHDDEHIVAMGAFRPVSGYITGFVDDIAEDAAEVKRMRVDPDRQHEGLGQQLYDELESRAGDAGFTEFVLDTTRQQVAAQKFYEANGFELATTEPLQFQDRQRELLFYRKSL